MRVQEVNKPVAYCVGTRGRNEMLQHDEMGRDETMGNGKKAKKKYEQR